MLRHLGWTVVELVVVLAVLALVAAIGTAAGSGTWAHGDAAAQLARRIAAVRWSAVATGRDAPCLPDDLPHGSRDDRSTTWPARGLTFTPAGLPRTCDGGGVGNTTILLEHRGRHAAVIVSSLGRVRWELR
jgi:Tfp pilus assembly protein FimT